MEWGFQVESRNELHQNAYKENHKRNNSRFSWEKYLSKGFLCFYMMIIYHSKSWNLGDKYCRIYGLNSFNVHFISIIS